MGAGDGAEDLQIGVVGVESASVSMSVGGSSTSLPGGGAMRSRIVTLFFFLFGLEILRGEGFVAFGVQTAKLRVQDSSSSMAIWIVVFDRFLRCWISSTVLMSSSV